MAAHSKIEWTDHTFNPWIGCTRLSAACDHCYAADMAHRYGWAKFEAGEPRHRTSAATWKKPLAWNRQAEANGVRARVFCASLADVFDAEVPDEWRSDLFLLIRDTPWIDWQLLTKRPQVAAKWWATCPMPSNIWLGTTVENQSMAELRIPTLMDIDGVKVRFLSCEPLLGPIDLTSCPDWLQGEPGWGERIDWVIAGGESGTSARPSNPNWYRALRDQCAAAAVPFFFKQWGEWLPVGQRAPIGKSTFLVVEKNGAADYGRGFVHMGKKAAGALLDDREHREFPQ